ncbi:helix-turn-helix transcriptional regulator [Holophaga foetida]|uniref:helix-turn-helix transcriptional regulator n=1 Tax=Holophaga foetida TaxID=35839 RepID=UPI0002471C26|nr:WYL domain-containing protein [Holophaga foetida]
MTKNLQKIETEGLVDQSRLKEVVRLMREAGPHGLTRQELASRMGGVSLRTVERSLKLLEGQKAEIERQREGRSTHIRYVMKEGPTWDEHVSTQARLALRLASLTLSQGATSILDDSLSALESLVTAHMSTQDKRLFETLQKAMQVHGGVDEYHEPPDILEPILKALGQGFELEVHYQAAAAKAPSPRTVVPHCLTFDIFSGGSYLAVWDPADRKPKHLRLSRIMEAKVGKRPGIIAEPELMARAARYQIGGWLFGGEPFQVRVRIRGTHWIESFREAPPALPDFEVQPLTDEEGVEVSFMANHLNGPSRWVLQFGSQARVLEPADLREHLRQQHLEAAANYYA